MIVSLNTLNQMYYLRFLASGLLALTLLLGHVSAQESRYVVYDYMKVLPGERGNYLACEQIWKKLHEQRKATGNIIRWELYEVLFPVGAEAEYDFVTLTTYDSWEAIMREDLNPQAAMATLSREDQEMVQRTTQYRTRVKSEIRELMLSESEPEVPSPFQVEFLVNILPRGLNPWLTNIREQIGPVQNLSIEQGQLAGWSASRVSMPRGQGLPYQAGVTYFFDQWTQIQQGRHAYYANWPKVHPDTSLESMQEEMRPFTQLYRTETRKLVDYLN